MTGENLHHNEVFVDTNYSYDFDVYPTIKQPMYVVVILSLTYGVIFVMSLVGNFLVIAVVFRNKGMRNTTNYFIVNLATADILVAIFCIPMTLLDSIYTGRYLYLVVVILGNHDSHNNVLFQLYFSGILYTSKMY